MKDAKGHGSDSRGGSALDTAISSFQAAHQAGVNQALPSQTGQQLYDAAMSAAHRNHPHDDYDANTRRQIEPDFDEMPGVGPDPYYPQR